MYALYIFIKTILKLGLSKIFYLTLLKKQHLCEVVDILTRDRKITNFDIEFD